MGRRFALIAADQVDCISHMPLSGSMELLGGKVGQTNLFTWIRTHKIDPFSVRTVCCFH